MNEAQRNLDQESADLDVRIAELIAQRKRINIELGIARERQQQIFKTVDMDKVKRAAQASRRNSTPDMKKIMRAAHAIDQARRVKEEAAYQFRVRKARELVATQIACPESSKIPTSPRTVVSKIAPGCKGFEHPHFLNGAE